MVSLSSFFPSELAKGRVLAQLIPGKVIKLDEVMDDGKRQEKRFLVLTRDDEHAHCLVINSEVSRFIQNRPEMAKCQVVMGVASHPFMSWDSYVDCSQVKMYPIGSTVQTLVDKNEWLLGDADAALRAAIVEALKDAPTLSDVEADAYGRCLSNGS